MVTVWKIRTVVKNSKKVSFLVKAVKLNSWDHINAIFNHCGKQIMVEDFVPIYQIILILTQLFYFYAWNARHISSFNSLLNSSKAKRFSFEWRLLSSLSIKFPMGAKLERLLFLIYSLLIKTLLLIITKVISDTDDRA